MQHHDMSCGLVSSFFIRNSADDGNDGASIPFDSASLTSYWTMLAPRATVGTMWFTQSAKQAPVMNIKSSSVSESGDTTVACDGHLNVSAGHVHKHCFIRATNRENQGWFANSSALFARIHCMATSQACSDCKAAVGMVLGIPCLDVSEESAVSGFHERISWSSDCTMSSAPPCGNALLIEAIICCSCGRTCNWHEWTQLLQPMVSI